MDQSQHIRASWAARLLAALVRGYQLVFSGATPRCRFVPSCSDYMREFLLSQGVVPGLFSGIARILKCHPWHPGGVDPVPPLKSHG